MKGRIGERGCVAWGFDKCGLIVVTPDSINEEELFLIAVEAGAEDVTVSETGMEIVTPFEMFDSVLTAVQETSAENPTPLKSV